MNTKKLTIVANIYAVKGKGELVKNELQKLILPTLAEKGCIQYDLHYNNNNPEHFVFFENWETRSLWLDHMETTHIKQYRKNVEGFLEDFIVHEMTQID
ncbi:MAG: putative quinol monooxygenase [Flavobacteriales bacterium]